MVGRVRLAAAELANDQGPGEALHALAHVALEPGQVESVGVTHLRGLRDHPVVLAPRFVAAPRPAGPQPRDGLRRALPFIAAPRPAGPSPATACGAHYLVSVAAHRLAERCGQ